MSIKIKFYFSCFLIALFQPSVTGGQYPFKFYSSKDGLQNKSVYSICTDHRGYVWFGTNNGGLYYLNSIGINARYDPDEFENAAVRKLYFTKNEELFIGTEKGLYIDDGLYIREIIIDTLKEIKVIGIFQDSGQNIWIGTANSGLYMLEFNDLTGEYKKPVKIQGLSSETFFSVCEDNAGRIWAGGFGGGIDIITFENNTIKIKKPDVFLYKNENLVTSIKYIGNNTILIGTRGSGVLRVKYNNTTFTLDNYLDHPFLSNGIIWDIEKDDSDRIWIATDKNGLIEVDADRQIFFNSKNGLPSNQVLTLCLSSKQLWIGTMGNGIGSLFSEHLLFYENEEISQDQPITSLAKYENQSVLIGTYGSGIYRVNIDVPSTQTRSALFLSAYLKDKYVTTLYFDGNDHVLIGTANEGLYDVTQNSHKAYTNEDGILLNSINTVHRSIDNRIWVGTNAGLSIISDKGVFNINDTQEYAIPNNEIQCIAEDHFNRIWIGTLGGLSCIENNLMTNFNKSDGLLSERINALFSDDSNLWIGTDGGGLFQVGLQTDTIRIKHHTEISENIPNIISILSVEDSILLLGSDRGLEILLLNPSWNVVQHRILDLNAGFSAGELIQNQIVALDHERAVAATNHGIIQVELHKLLGEDDIRGKLYIEHIELPLHEYDWNAEPDNLLAWQQIPAKLNLKHYQNYISFQLASNIVINAEAFDYEYKLMQNKNKAWLKAGKDGIITLTNLRFGKYRLQARMVNSNSDIVSGDLNYSFEITPPFYFTWWFLAVVITVIFLSGFIVIKIREKNLIQRNIQLENTVQQRTSEIVQQKNQIEEQKEIIELKNKDITDSINYASKIQQALLPSEKTLANNFRDYFILYIPRDIVSGDFYWVLEKNNKTICVLADCTGHGVPGAFMSMLGLSLLSEIVAKNNITEPEKILDRLREEIIRTLKQEDPSNPKDGMDLSICVINRSLRKVYYSGANSSLQIVRNNELIELKGNRMPVAFYYEMESFDVRTFSLEKDDCIYMFTDGYTDQFGGADGKKFMKKPLKRLLLEISGKELLAQKKILENTLIEWMKGHEQVDDISVLGFKI